MNTLVTGADSLSTALSQMATATSLSEEQQAQLSTLSTNLTDLNTAIQNLKMCIRDRLMDDLVQLPQIEWQYKGQLQP